MQPKFSDWLNRKPKGRAPKKPLPKMSKRKGADIAIYKKMLPGWIRANPVCKVCDVIKAAGYSVRCTKKTTHPHHIRGRNGPLLYDERYMMPACSGEGHPQWIHFTAPSIARQIGLLAQHGQG